MTLMLVTRTPNDTPSSREALASTIRDSEKAASDAFQALRAAAKTDAALRALITDAERAHDLVCRAFQREIASVQRAYIDLLACDGLTEDQRARALDNLNALPVPSCSANPRKRAFSDARLLDAHESAIIAHYRTLPGGPDRAAVRTLVARLAQAAAADATERERE